MRDAHGKCSRTVFAGLDLPCDPRQAPYARLLQQIGIPLREADRARNGVAAHFHRGGGLVFNVVPFVGDRRDQREPAYPVRRDGAVRRDGSPRCADVRHRPRHRRCHPFVLVPRQFGQVFLARLHRRGGRDRRRKRVDPFQNGKFGFRRLQIRIVGDRFFILLRKRVIRGSRRIDRILCVERQIADGADLIYKR